MNKENAHLFLPLVQALAEGKIIQNRVLDGDHWWDSNGNIEFSLPPEYYRIKHEPRTFEMWLTPTGSMHTLSQLSHSPWKTSDCERIAVQEVLE